MTPAIWLMRTAQTFEDRPAILHGTDIFYSYGQFADLVQQGAARLRAMGATPGARIAIFAANCPEYLIALYAIWHAGCIAVPINGKLHVKEAAWILSNAEASICFTNKIEDLTPLCPNLDLLPLTAQSLNHDTRLLAPHRYDPDDTLWLFYTSGTTGRPKGVMIPARAIQAMTSAYFSDVDDVQSQDAALYAAPMSHGAGLYNFMHVLRGARHVIPRSQGFDPHEILKIAPRLQNVSMFAAPTMVRRLVERARTLGLNGEGLKTIVYGGGPMYGADIRKALDVIGPRFVQIYGQGECPMAITALSRQDIADRTHPNWAQRLNSVGRAQSPVAIELRGEDGRPVKIGQPGEICVKSSLVMTGYWRNPSATNQTVQDNWLCTGDIGRMDADGYLTLIDRSKDLIISGGTNIYPREVEETLLDHPALREVAVVGQPDTEWGERVVAFVVSHEGNALDLTALDSHCRAHIADFKRPRHYIQLPNLPKNNYGKVLKTRLREMLSQTE